METLFDPEAAREATVFSEKVVLTIEGYFQGVADVRPLKRFSRLQKPAAPAPLRKMAYIEEWVQRSRGYHAPFRYGDGARAYCVCCDMSEASYETAHTYELKVHEFHAKCACLDIWEYCAKRGVTFVPTDSWVYWFGISDPEMEFFYSDNRILDVPNGKLTEDEIEMAGKYADEVYPAVSEIDIQQYDQLNRLGVHLRNLDVTDGVVDVLRAYSFFVGQSDNAYVYAKVRGLGPFFEGRIPMLLSQHAVPHLESMAELYWPQLRHELRMRPIRWRKQLGKDWEKRLPGLLAQTSLAPEEFQMPIDLNLLDFFEPI